MLENKDTEVIIQNLTYSESAAIGGVNCVIVKELSRLFRNYYEAGN